MFWLKRTASYSNHVGNDKKKEGYHAARQVRPSQERVRVSLADWLSRHIPKQHSDESSDTSPSTSPLEKCQTSR